MKTLKNLFLNELSDIYDAESRIAKALPKLADAATSHELQDALEAHLVETEGQVTKLIRVFECFDMKPKGKKCEATVGLLEEGDEIIKEFKGFPVINAAIIAAAQKVEHYEIAAYGCLTEWAALLGNEEAAAILQEILEEEKAANNTLNNLATGGCNEEALGDSEVEKKKEKPAKAKATTGRKR